MASKNSRNQQGPKQNPMRQANEVKELLEDIEDSVSLPDEVSEEQVILTAEELAEAESANVIKARDVWIKAKRKLVAWEKAFELLERDREHFKKDCETLKLEKDQFHEELKSLNDEKASLINLKLSFEANFEPERMQLLAATQNSAENIISDARKVLADAQSEAHELMLRTQEEISELKSKNSALELSLSERERNMDLRETQLRDAQQRFDDKDSRALELIQERHADDLLIKTEEIEDLRRDKLRQAETIKSLREKLANFGDTPEELQSEISRLTQENEELQDELAQRPPATDIEELRFRANLAADAQLNVKEWQRKYYAISQQLENQQIPAIGLESLRDQKKMLEAQIETLRQVIDRNRQDWEELQEKSTAAEPFPACSNYDREIALSSPGDSREFDDLKSLTDEVRNRMAQGDTPLYYSDSDVRLFLGGMASSRLHLLQGISGTGKTSLPLRFFQALSGHDAAQIIEVQAGWRDQDDLFGYYNAFEKRYVESEFTKALYRALLPANEDRAMVIILDEMNLSHPEQYFGSMLSILEKPDRAHQQVPLLSSSIPGLPARLADGKLPLATNVWFVGTANHDETTVAFADKTYDRSHVQELPDRPIPFEPRVFRGGGDPISFSELQVHFSRAGDAQSKETEKARDFLNSDLRRLFAEVGVGWGSRLDRQLSSFVPVVISAGGTATEALDHIVATRLLRKVIDRFDIRADDLELLASGITESWELDGEEPIKSIGKLEASVAKMHKDN